MDAADDQYRDRGPHNTRGEGAPDIPDQTGPGQPVRLSVPVALGGERVDRALALLIGVSRAHASRLMAEGRGGSERVASEFGTTATAAGR